MAFGQNRSDVAHATSLRLLQPCMGALEGRCPRYAPLRSLRPRYLAIYDDAGVLIETTSASRQSTTQVPNVPAESAAKPAQVSTAARTYLDYGAMGDAGDRTKVAIPMPHALLVRKAHLNGYRLRMSDRIERRLSEAEHGTL